MKDCMKISDRGLLTWLRMKDHKYIGYRVDGKRVVFKFQVSDQLIDDIDFYNNKQTCQLSPFKFVKELEGTTEIIFQILKDRLSYIISFSYIYSLLTTN